MSANLFHLSDEYPTIRVFYWSRVQTLYILVLFFLSRPSRVAFSAGKAGTLAMGVSSEVPFEDETPIARVNLRVYNCSGDQNLGV
jgi:hypothetical protein